MTYLAEYLQRRRDAQTQDEQSPEDLLLALTANMEQVVSLTQQSNKAASRETRAVVGAVNSATMSAQVAAETAHELSKEQVQVFVDFAKKTTNTSRLTNKTLREINATLKELGESLVQLVKYAKPKPSKEGTRSKRDSKLAATQPQDRMSDTRGSKSGPLDMLLGSMFDASGAETQRGRRTGRRRTVGNRAPNKRDLPESPGGSWWDKLKNKLPDAKGLGSLWEKIPKSVKLGSGGVLAAATALPAAYQLAVADDQAVDKPKEAAKIAARTVGSVGGWAAGAAGGAALGAMTGPLAPIAVPAGMLLGGIGASVVGSEVGNYAGDKAIDAYRIARDVASSTAEELSSSIADTYKNSILPGFDKAASNLSVFVDDLGTSMSTFMELFGKSVDELTAELGSGAEASAAAAAGIWASFKRRASETVDTGRKAIGDVTASYHSNGVSGATATAKTAAAEIVESAKKSARGFASDVSATKGLAVGRWTDDEYAAITHAQNSGKSFKAGSNLSPEVREKIVRKAAAAGVDPQHLMAMAQMESGGNTYAVSSTGAAGLFQFTGGTGKAYGITNRFDEDQNIDAAIRLYKDNKAALEKRGEKATLENIYLAHQQGAGGAANLLKAARGEAKIRDDVARNMAVNVGGKEGGATDAEKAARFIEANRKHIASASNKALKDAAVQVIGINPDTNVQHASANVPDASLNVQHASNTTSNVQHSTDARANVQHSTDARANVRQTSNTTSTRTNYSTQQQKIDTPQTKPPTVGPIARSVEVQSLRVGGEDVRPPPAAPASVVHSVASAPKVEPPVIRTVSAQPMQRVAPEMQVSEIRPVVVANAEQIVPRQAEPKQERVVSPTLVSTSQVPSLENTPMHISDLGIVLLNMGQL